MQQFEKLNPKEIPQVDLYMDQVLTILEQQMKSYKIEVDEKIMTKTMINNYVKSKLMEKPEKKKYNKEQIMQLIMIYHTKNILSFAELDTFFKSSIYEYDNSIQQLYHDFVVVHDEVLEDVRIKVIELTQLEGKEQIKELMKTIIQADLNKRIAEGLLKDIKDLDE